MKIEVIGGERRTWRPGYCCPNCGCTDMRLLACCELALDHNGNVQLIDMADNVGDMSDDILEYTTKCVDCKHKARLADFRKRVPA